MNCVADISVFYDDENAIAGSETGEALRDIIENDPETADLLAKDMADTLNHGIVVSMLARSVAKNLKASEEFTYRMAVAGLMHDIGKLQIAHYLYGHEDGTLRIEEIKFIRMHSRIGYEILKKNGYDDIITESVLHHHENFDGSGYPDNVKGLSIPFGARILRVCDVFSALVSERQYRRAYPPEVAVKILIDEVKNFDMRCFLALQKSVNSPEFKEVLDVIENQNRQYSRVRPLQNDLNLDLW